MNMMSWIVTILSFQSSSANIFSHTAPRVVGGKDAPSKRHPYYVFLSGSDGVCGGSLIAPNIVLTAAHCPQVSFARVGIGNNDGSIGFDEIFSIRGEIIHPAYDSNTKQFDQKLLVLNRPSHSPTISLGIENFEEDLFGVEMKLLGLGQDDEGNYADHLQEAQQTILPTLRCQESKDPTFTFEDKLFDDMFCVEGDQKGACFGDSGGPLIVEGSSVEDDFLVGTVSWGLQPCGQWPTVFSSISKSYEWILETVCTSSTNVPASFPCPSPTSLPSFMPSVEPTLHPSGYPSSSWNPTRHPSSNPSSAPSNIPSDSPSLVPSQGPTESSVPSIPLSTSLYPSFQPSERPTDPDVLANSTTTSSRSQSGIDVDLTANLQEDFLRSSGTTVSSAISRVSLGGAVAILFVVAASALPVVLIIH